MWYSGGMIVNKTLLDKDDIDIPENYAEFADACVKLQENGNIVVHLAMTELTSRNVKALVEAYLKDTGTHFRVTNKYELPIVEDKQIDKIEISY